MTEILDQIVPGQEVAVTQQIQQGDSAWTTRVVGTVVSYGQSPTGSWFAHTRDGRLWLDRVVLRKDDGELVVCDLDEYTHIERIDGSAPGAGGGPA
jgi:hypothetical protein